MHSFVLKSAAERKWVVFRGQADSEWSLVPTLHREYAHLGIDQRFALQLAMNDEFRKQVHGVSASTDQLGLADLDRLALLARHSGMPSDMLDWSRSPYIAAFFAFSDPSIDYSSPTAPTSAAIWAISLDDPQIQDALFDGLIEVVDQPEHYEVVRRAAVQQALAIRVLSESGDLAALVGANARKFVIPLTARQMALDTLEYMQITHSMLYADLDGAARTAIRKIERERLSES